MHSKQDGSAPSASIFFATFGRTQREKGSWTLLEQSNRGGGDGARLPSQWKSIEIEPLPWWSHGREQQHSQWLLHPLIPPAGETSASVGHWNRSYPASFRTNLTSFGILA